MYENFNKTTEDNAFIMDYLRLLKSHWLIVTLSVIVCCAVAYVYLYFAPKLHERTEQIIIKEDNLQNIVKLDEINSISGINLYSLKTNINDHVELLRSPKFMIKAVEKSHLDIRYTTKHRFKTTELYPSPVELSFCEEVGSGNFSFTIIPTSDNKVKINNFKNESVDVADYEKEVIIGDTFLTPAGKMVLSFGKGFDRSNLNKTIHVSKSNAKDLGMRFSERLSVSSNKNNNIITLSIKDNSSVRVESILNALIEVYNEEYNNYRNQNLENISAFINGRIENIEQGLKSENKNYQKTQEELYFYLLQSREINEFIKQVAVSNYEIADRGIGKSSPVSPQKSKILLLAVFLGLLIPCSILFLKQLLNTKIQSPNDIVNQTNIPLVGIIPQSKPPRRKLFSSFKSKTTKYILALENKISSPENEAFQVLCSNVDFIKMQNQNRAKCIMITSTEDNSGKSFVALNFSTHLAYIGKKVALLDLDFRKASITKHFELSIIGMSDCLDDIDMSIIDIVAKEQFHPNLDIYASGANLAYPTPLLFGNRLAELVNVLSQSYDYIIIDTTSTQTADASIIATIADISLFVVRENLTHKNQIANLENMHKENRYKNMSVLYNGMQKR